VCSVCARRSACGWCGAPDRARSAPLTWPRPPPGGGPPSRCPRTASTSCGNRWDSSLPAAACARHQHPLRAGLPPIRRWPCPCRRGCHIGRDLSGRAGKLGEIMRLTARLHPTQHRDLARVLHLHSRQRPTGEAGSVWRNVSQSGFHLADVELDRLGRRGSKGAPDTFDVTGYVALLRRIREDADDMIYAPAFDRALGQPIAGSIPIPRAARLIISEGNYLLLRGGDWACARSEFDEVWYCDLAEGERVRRLVARHERFGKDHDAALAWAMGTDQRNADLISLTRSSADLVIGDVVFQGLQEAAHAYRAADVGAGGKVAIIMDQRRLQHPL